MRVSEIRVNQGLGVVEIVILSENSLTVAQLVTTVIFFSA